MQVIHEQKCVKKYGLIHYRQKIWNIFYFSDFFAFLWSVQGVSVLEIQFYEQILLSGGGGGGGGGGG